MIDASPKPMYINGEWVFAEGGATFDVINPADQSTVASIANGAKPEIERAVQAASAAFREWSALAPKDRGRILLGIQELMEERRDELARLVTLENGKPFEEAKKEVQFSLGYFGWFAEEARRMSGEWVASPQPSKRYWVLHQPIGPVAAVTPWNFPATMVTRKIAPALAAGCSVVLKPASATPLTALAIAQITRDDGLHAGVVHALDTNRSGPVGPQINEDTRAKVQSLVQDAVARGARLVSGGHYLTDGPYKNGFFYAPAVLLDVTDDMAIAQEEIFGPAAPLLLFDTEEEVIRRANATKFGLAAYFYTKDMTRLMRVSEQLEYGLVGANDATGYTHEIPLGGFKESGLGRQGGHEGIEEYTEVKSVVINLA